jgi:hypothetical protein
MQVCQKMSIYRRDGQPRMQKPVREEPFASLEANAWTLLHGQAIFVERTAEVLDQN